MPRSRRWTTVRAEARFLLAVLGAFAFAPWPCPEALAQSRTTGALAGRVEDQSGGGALPGSTVAIASPALLGGTRTASTDAQGRFRFAELPPGPYSVTASAQGYR